MREIKDSFGRFAAIFGIVALGVGFLSGLLVTTPDMHNSVDEYYDKNNMADIFIKGTMGLTQEDLDSLMDLEYTKEIMPAYVTDVLMDTSNNELLATRVYGLPLLKDMEESTINKLVLLEGRMPENINEALVERSSPFLTSVEIGSKLAISTENEDYEDTLDRYNFKEVQIVGVVGNTFHFSKEREVTNIGNGRLSSIIYVDRQSYNLEVYTDFYITATNAKEMNAFSSAYDNLISKLTKDLEEIGKERSVLRYHEIRNLAYDELVEGYIDYETGKEETYQELKKAEIEILDGEAELTDAYRKIQDGRREIKEGKEELYKQENDALKELEEGKIELEDALTKLQDGSKELEDGLKELEDGKEELETALDKLLDGEKEYEKGYEEYIIGLEEIEDGKLQIEDAKKKLDEGVLEIQEGYNQLENGRLSLANAKMELESGEREYEAGLSALNENKRLFQESTNPIALALGYKDSDELFDEISNDETGVVILSLDGYLNGARSTLNTNLDEINLAILNIEIAKSSLEELKLIPEPTQTQLEQIEYLEGVVALGESQLPLLMENKSIIEAQLSMIPDNSSQLIYGYNQIKLGESRLLAARSDLDWGWEEYNKGEIELSSAASSIESGQIEIENGKKEIEENEIKLQDGIRKLEEAKIELDKAKLEIESGWKEYEDGKIDLEDGYKKYEEAKLKIDEGYEEYYKGLEDYEEGKKTFEEEINKGKAEIQKAEIELADGIKEYEEGLKELQDGRIEYQDAIVKVEEELADALVKLVDGENDIRDIQDPKWYVLNRNQNMSFVSFTLNADKVAAISKIFPIFFYLVAGLVSLTTMTRMVEEERTQMGVLKALGYKKSTVMAKYLIYCGLASVLGSIGGHLVGFKLLPLVLWNAYGIMYHLPDFITDYNFRIALISSGFAILSTMGATVYAVNEALREKPATLMLPRAPKAGKRILLERAKFIWKRMSFNQKATARNIFRYKKHFYMTIIGISGCTALLVTGFGLRDSIADLAITQFERIFNYDIEIELDEKIGIDDKLRSILEDESKVQAHLGVYTEKGSANYKDEYIDANLVVVNDLENISNFIDLKNRKTRDKLSLQGGNVIVTEKMAEVLKVSKGDMIKYETSEGKFIELKVGDITENYLGNYIYIEESVYKVFFNEGSNANVIYIKTGVEDLSIKEDLIGLLLPLEQVLNADIIAQTRNTFANLVESIDYIVIVIILASGLLAFIVLYNLTNININERKKELATLKVLGYHNKEVSNYIFKEITILAIIGILVGLLLGKYMHSFIVLTVEDPDFMFGRGINLSSYVLAFVVTMVFSFIVNIFMSKKLRNIKMVDSLKAND